MSSEQKLDLTQLRNDVEHEIQNEGHHKIANICRTVLASAPNELLWLRLLCCAMIHLSQTRALLKFIDTYSNKQQIYHVLLFYKIYCLYLLKQNQEAHTLLLDNRDKIQVKEDRIALEYLEYQIYYRLGKYESAFNALSQISDNQHLHQIAINEICTLIAMDRASDAVDKYYHKQHDMDASLYRECDFVFNLATALLLCNDVENAKTFLISSITKCNNAMKEEQYEESEIESEIANLELLIAYCLYMEGDMVGASQYYHRLKDKQQIKGIYENLILQNNCLATKYYDEWTVAGYKVIQVKKDKHKKGKKKSKYIRINKAQKAEYDTNLVMYNKLLSNKNDDNFSRFGANGVTQSMKAYHNKCMILIRNPSKSNVSQFKSMIARIQYKDALSELPLFLKISYHLTLGEYQQIKDILYHHISSNPNASTKACLYYIEILIEMKKYRMAIAQIRGLTENEVKYSQDMMNIVLDLASRLNDNHLKVEMMKEWIQYLRETQSNVSVLVSLEIDLCHLLISLKRTKEAKDSAERLYRMDRSNNVYKAMLLLSAVHDDDMETAQKVSSEIKLDVEYDAYAVDELLVEVPNVMDNEDIDSNAHFSFEITPHIELQRKRKEQRRKREKKAMKLRKQYEEYPELRKDPVDWESKKQKHRTERNKSNSKSKPNVKGKNKAKTAQKNKKKAAFRGAQGGTGHTEKYDIADEKNKIKGGKTVIPDHIRKKRKRG